MDNRKNPFERLADRADLFDLLGEVFNIDSMKRDKAVRVTKGATQTKIEIDVPGCARENVTIDVSDNILKVEWHGLGGEGIREFRIDRRAKATFIEATVVNGLLSILIPMNESATPQRIKVK